MKRLNFLLILSLSFLLFTNLTCEKEETSIPSVITIEELLNTEAKEVFVCLINGEYWEDNTISTFYSVSAGNLNVESNKGSKNFIGFSCLEVFDEVIYTPFDAVRFTSSCVHYLDTNKVNTLDILSIDKENRTMVGTFDFHLIGGTNDSDCLGDTIHVTEGRFKMPF